MKNVFKYIAVALATSLLALGCYPEILAPDQSQLPSAESLDVVIDVDQTTNYVTFTVTNEGVVPMWIFGGEDKVDNGKVSKRYAYTVNGLKLRVRDAGTHQVEVKAYNANGVSVGSKIVEYTLENTYRDPFDPAPHMKKLAGEWMWNSSVDGHFGCGPDFNDPKGWWAAGANEKADWSLYNDTMTFTEDGKYAFNPGEDGKVYVNKDVTQLGGPQSEDFLVDIPAYETTYTIENNWNDAGIEEIWLVLPEKKNLSYVPNDFIYSDPRFLVLESKAKKSLKLAANNAPNGDGTISWLYDFVPAVKVATPEELLAGTDGKGKVWVMDSDAKGHLACGSSPENPTEWWSAGANEKADFGMYDDEITFYPDGKYVYSAGADGKLYINKDVTVIGSGAASKEDVDIDWTTTESTYTFDGENLVLAANSPMVYVHSNSMYENPVYKVTAISETSLTVVAMNEGCYWQMIFKARDVKAPAGPTINGSELPVELSVQQNEVLALGNITPADIWVDPDFFEVSGAGLKFKAVDGDYQFQYDKNAKWIKVVPMVSGNKATYDTGKALWIIGDGGGKPTDAQIVGWNTGDAPLPFAKIGENTYQITLAMKGEGGSVKVFGQSDWGVEWKSANYGTFNANGLFKLGNGTDGDDGNIYHTDSPAGYYTFTVVDNDGTLDMTVEKYRDPSDLTGLTNMWDNAAIDVSFWFADGGWAQIANPEYEAEGTSHTIVVPEGIGADQWQGQMVFNHTGLVLTTDKKYSFQVKLTSSEDHPHVTIKPCYQHPTELDGNGNPKDVNEVLYVTDIKLTAGEEFVYTAAGLAGTDIPDLKLVFDFGGAVAGSTITIKDITLVEL